MNGWVDFDPAVYEPAGYRKDALGYVELKGLVKSGTANADILSLPAGFRPALRRGFACPTSGGTAQLQVRTDGTVGQINGNNTFQYLDGIRFNAA